MLKERHIEVDVRQNSWDEVGGLQMVIESSLTRLVFRLKA